MFNSLESRGVVEDAVVADLFAGSGALGIEALSRGARHAVFVEADRRTAQVIRANVAALGAEHLATVVVCDVLDWVKLPSGGAGDPSVVLIDPPYGFSAWDEVLGALAVRGPLLVVAESDRPVEAPGWDALAVKRHGGTVVSQLRPRGANTT